MRISERIQLLACLMVYAPSAHAIMVKFGTNQGPIQPPPAPLPAVPPQKPYRVPAPVWEDQFDDLPNPNAHWNQFHIQPMYTNVLYKTNTLSNLKKFVSSYVPRNPQPIQAEPVKEYLTPTQLISQLSAQHVAGVGLRYFAPSFNNEPNRNVLKRNENQIDVDDNEVSSENDHTDKQWKQEKQIFVYFKQKRDEAKKEPSWPVHMRHL